MYEIFQKVFSGGTLIVQHCTSPKSQNSGSDSLGNQGVANYITDQTSQYQLWPYLVQLMIQITRMPILETQQNRQLSQLMLRVTIYYSKCLVNMNREEKRDQRFRKISENFPGSCTGYSQGRKIKWFN